MLQISKMIWLDWSQHVVVTQSVNLGGTTYFIDFNSINTIWLAAWQTLPGQCPYTFVFIVHLIGHSYRLAAGRKRAWRRPKIHSPSSQTVCLKQEALRSNMISWGSRLNHCMCTLHCEITCACACERWGWEYFVGTWCMQATALRALNQCIEINHAITNVQECISNTQTLPAA